MVKEIKKIQPQGYVALRTLTLKSILGITKYRNLTIQQMIDGGQNDYLTLLYYKNSHINFTEEILIALKVTKIQKPGISKELAEEMIQMRREEIGERIGRARERKSASLFFREDRIQKKEKSLCNPMYLMRCNHGHKGK